MTYAVCKCSFAFQIREFKVRGIKFSLQSIVTVCLWTATSFRNSLRSSSVILNLSVIHKFIKVPKGRRAGQVRDDHSWELNARLIQPRVTEIHPLWELCKVRNHDKHQFIKSNVRFISRIWCGKTECAEFPSVPVSCPLPLPWPVRQLSPIWN